MQRMQNVHNVASVTLDYLAKSLINIYFTALTDGPNQNYARPSFGDQRWLEARMSDGMEVSHGENTDQPCQLFH